MTPVLVHISIQHVYRFDGWEFELYRTKPFPPWPLKKDGDPRERAGRKFWKMIDQFLALSEEEQEQHRIV